MRKISLLTVLMLASRCSSSPLHVATTTTMAMVLPLPKKKRSELVVDDYLAALRDQDQDRVRGRCLNGPLSGPRNT